MPTLLVNGDDAVTRFLPYESWRSIEEGCRLLERLGFRNEGLLRKRWVAKGEAYDTKIYGLLREEWSPRR